VAAVEGQLEVITFLVEKKKAPIDAKDRDGWTPLHCACHSGHLEAVDKLVAYGANVNIATSNGSLPLHYFVRIPTQVLRWVLCIVL